MPQSVIWICFLTFVHSCPFGANEHRTSSIFNLSIVMRLFYHFKFRLSTAKSAGRAALLCGHRFNLFCRLFCRTKNLPTKSRRFFNNNSGSCRFRPFVCLPNQRLFRFLSKLLSKHAHAEPCNCKRIGNAPIGGRHSVEYIVSCFIPDALTMLVQQIFPPLLIAPSAVFIQRMDRTHDMERSAPFVSKGFIRSYLIPLHSLHQD